MNRKDLDEKQKSFANECDGWVVSPYYPIDSEDPDEVCGNMRRHIRHINMCCLDATTSLDKNIYEMFKDFYE